ncbi:Molybdenum cofactor biosynthesis bifunctional protein [Madurella mycetomatis]|uniref:Molybdenum cofactor biosynthesis bifunctional protein n=1 Tax=Madurella mycetomatis TaxID=100816 RepID=A0A175W1L4_9PEZI|nr:Molybdenum cofactor biosynthesis bifunctional protein [Madurella mycetomatis]
MDFTPLILAGGKSTRMGSPKHLLPMPDGRPLYQHQIELLHRALPSAPAIYVSLAQDSQLDPYLESLTPPRTTANPTGPSPPTYHPKPSLPPHLRISLLRDLAPNLSPTSSAGPAAGLLAALHARPAATWLVVPCDHPFLNPAALRRLCHAYQPPVTCFRNPDGFREPLIGVWSAAALRRLRDRVVESAASTGAGAGAGAGVGNGGRGCGPSRIVRELEGREVTLDEAEGEGRC